MKRSIIIAAMGSALIVGNSQASWTDLIENLKAKGQEWLESFSIQTR